MVYRSLSSVVSTLLEVKTRTGKSNTQVAKLSTATQQMMRDEADKRLTFS